MQIQTRLMILFSLVTALLLLGFSAVVYYLYADFRQEEYFLRIRNKAIMTAELLLDVQERDRYLLNIFDRNTLHSLVDEKILVYDEQDSIVYKNIHKGVFLVDKKKLNEIKKYNELRYEEGKNEVLGLVYKEEGKPNYTVVIAAYDYYGKRKLDNLKYIIITALLISLFVTLVIGRLFAAKALQPISEMTEEINNIAAHNLHTRIDEGNGKDELARLAKIANEMLSRLEDAFAMQRSFVSNASHELRNPLAAIRSQLQVAIAKPRSTEEYAALLSSLQDDVQQLSTLTNSLLSLAKFDAQQSLSDTTAVRIDEALLSAQAQLQAVNPAYSAEIGFAAEPEDDTDITTMGNEAMLVSVFLNLMENACKFSPNTSVAVAIDMDGKYTRIQFIDTGKGISAEDKKRVFEPFYRTSDAAEVAGHGVGLSLCKRIVELHKGTIQVSDNPVGGTIFTICLPHI